MRIIVLQQDAMIADVVCGLEAVFVGSREGCRVCLSDTRIAAQQLLLLPETGGQWVLEQLDPGACEVVLNQQPVTQRMPLKTGDEIQLLEYTLRVYPEFEEQPGARTELGTSRVQLERFAASRLPSGTLVKKLDEQLLIQPGQLHRIGQANLAVSQCTTVEGLMDIALRFMLETFNAQRAWLGIRRVNYGSMEYVEGRFITGQPADLPEFGDNLKPRVLDRSQFVLTPMLSPTERVSCMSGPLAGPDGTLGMVYVDTGDSGRRYDVKDLDFFILMCNAFGVQLDAIFRSIAANRAATIEGQVSVAHEIQARLTPRKLPQWDELQFGAFREPGRERTGDMYDVVKLGNGQSAFMVAHTRAAGALPSMLMAQAQAAFRCTCLFQHTPAVFLRTLNIVLYDGQKDHAQDGFMGIIDPATGQLQYSMAGRTGAYIIGNRGEERRLGSLEPTPSLGLARATVYPLLTEELAPEETLVLFTPGVTTARSRKDEVFGEDRFVNILCDGFGQLASAMLKEMLTDLRNFTEGGQQPEDITVILAHRV